MPNSTLTPSGETGRESLFHLTVCSHSQSSTTGSWQQLTPLHAQGMSHVCHTPVSPSAGGTAVHVHLWVPLMPLSIFIRRLMMVSLLSPCLMSILVEKWPLQG